jgi:hypothetical protein
VPRLRRRFAGWTHTGADEISEASAGRPMPGITLRVESVHLVQSRLTETTSQGFDEIVASRRSQVVG